MRRGRRLWPAAALVVAAKENDVGGIIAEAMLLLAMTRAVAGDGLRMLRPTISDVLLFPSLLLAEIFSEARSGTIAQKQKKKNHGVRVAHYLGNSQTKPNP
jgi:hypothetical protein